MSKISLTGNPSGSGVLTIASPNTDTDRTIDLPDAAGTVFVSGQALTATTGSFSGDVTLGSSVLATPSGSAPSYTCRAWVRFNGTGTVAIIGSGNVSSVTDNGTANYAVNFATAMPDTNWAGFVTTASTGGSAAAFTYHGTLHSINSTTSTGVNTTAYNVGTVLDDAPIVNVSIFR